MDKRKRCLFFILFLLMVSAVTVSFSQETQAAGKKAAALKAYKKILKKQKAGTGTDGNVEFAVKDVNHDGMPELIISERNGGVNYLYIYNGKKAVIIDWVRHGDFVFYKKGKAYAIDYCNTFGVRYRSYRSVVKGKCKILANSMDERALVSPNQGVQYKIGEQKVSKKDYDAYVKKLTKNSKTLTLKRHKITEKNIKKYCK